MEELYALRTEGSEIADDPDFQRGNRNPNREYYEDYLVETGIFADLKAVEDKVADVIGRYGEGDASMDKELAPTVHRAIPVTRREAADERMWHYLAVVRIPSFVWYRWPRDDPDRTQQSMREKFLGRHRDIYSNAFHRLWWIAELTHDGDDYQRTEKALTKQRLANTIFDRGFRRSATVSKACVDLLHEESDPVIEMTTLRLNHALSSVPVEGIPEKEIRRRIEEIRDDVKS